MATIVECISQPFSHLPSQAVNSRSTCITNDNIKHVSEPLTNSPSDECDDSAGYRHYNQLPLQCQPAPVRSHHSQSVNTARGGYGGGGRQTSREVRVDIQSVGLVNMELDGIGPSVVSSGGGGASCSDMPDTSELDKLCNMPIFT